MLVDIAPRGIVLITEVVGNGSSVNWDIIVRSKILSHFIKGKISRSPMEIILMILGELEHLENLVKLARRKKDSEATENQVSMVSTVPTLRKICINKTHWSKLLHLLMEINNYVVEGLVDTRAFMSVMVTDVVKKLGIMHFLNYKFGYRV